MLKGNNNNQLSIPHARRRGEFSGRHYLLVGSRSLLYLALRFAVSHRSILTFSPPSRQHPAPRQACTTLLHFSTGRASPAAPPRNLTARTGSSSILKLPLQGLPMAALRHGVHRPTPPRDESKTTPTWPFCYPSHSPPITRLPTLGTEDALEVPRTTSRDVADLMGTV